MMTKGGSVATIDAPKLLAHLQALGCVLRVDGAILHVSPRHLLTPELRTAIGVQKPALMALLAAPVETAYGHYHSTVLDADFWVCETQADAEALRAEGEVPYTAEEIWLLQQMRERDPRGFIGKLERIHEAKVLGWDMASVEHAENSVTSNP